MATVHHPTLTFNTTENVRKIYHLGAFEHLYSGLFSVDHTISSTVVTLLVTVHTSRSNVLLVLLLRSVIAFCLIPHSLYVYADFVYAQFVGHK